MIEGDIKGYFDTVDHKILTQLIKDRLNPDRTIMGLIGKMLKAGYMEDGKYKHSILGIPQGGILSPLLSNLYLTPFDEFVDNIKAKYNKTPVSKSNPEYKKLEKKIINRRDKLARWTNKPHLGSPERIKVIKKEIQKIKKKLRSIPSKIRIGCKIHYVRYADD